MQNNMLIALIARAVLPITTLLSLPNAPRSHCAVRENARWCVDTWPVGFARAPRGVPIRKTRKRKRRAAVVEFCVNEQFCTASVAPRGTSFAVKNVGG